MDAVKRPAHYTTGHVECIDAIESMIGDDSSIDYCRAQAVKYIWRLPHKGKPLQDARKAQFYIDRLVEKLIADNGKDQRRAGNEGTGSDKQKADPVCCCSRAD